MDSVAAQKKFKEKQGLNYPLLADPEKALLKALGVLKDKVMYGKKVKGTVRATFLVGADGVVRKTWEVADIPAHPGEVLAAAALP
jgi:peroxiredoxin Q/BCP